MPYRHQLVRDVAWLISSPPLLRAGLRGCETPPRAWLEQLAQDALPLLARWDEDPAPLAAWCRAHSDGEVRLGHHAQALLGCLLHHLPGLSLVGQRCVILQDGRTLGDVDLIFSCAQRSALILWEVTVKFYLGNPPGLDPGHWHAPHPRQCLRDKLDRIIHHQLPVARAHAASVHPAGPHHCEAFVAGWLFHPAPVGTVSATPGAISPDHQRGWWLRHGSAVLTGSTRAARFRILEPIAWMSPARSPNGACDLLSSRECAVALSRHFRSGSASVLVAEMLRALDGWWGERQRIMVVDPAWPDVAAMDRRVRH